MHQDDRLIANQIANSMECGLIEIPSTLASILNKLNYKIQILIYNK